jgi:hypothetical protein
MTKSELIKRMEGLPDDTELVFWKWGNDGSKKFALENTCNADCIAIETGRSALLFTASICEVKTCTPETYQQIKKGLDSGMTLDDYYEYEAEQNAIANFEINQ